MSYNPVPTVATGDLWTASNHNTYIRDNFAAGVPDIFAAAGDLAYATGANVAGRMGIGSAGNSLLVTPGILPAWGFNPVFFVPALGNTSWDGDAKSTGITTITANSFHASIPATARALIISVSAQWNTISGDPVVLVGPKGHSGENWVIARSPGYPNFFSDAVGPIPLVGGQFDVDCQVAGPTAVYLKVLGYLP